MKLNVKYQGKAELCKYRHFDLVKLDIGDQHKICKYGHVISQNQVLSVK